VSSRSDEIARARYVSVHLSIFQATVGLSVRPGVQAACYHAATISPRLSGSQRVSSSGSVLVGDGLGPGGTCSMGPAQVALRVVRDQEVRGSLSKDRDGRQPVPDDPCGKSTSASRRARLGTKPLSSCSGLK
jgi:hypothetical protein